MSQRRFRCFNCGEEFYEGSFNEVQCPKCRSRVVMLLEGPSLRRGTSSSGSDGGSCPLCNI
jgi:DNA-directed RNA polymerase subunit RPC12/RpoP